MHRLSQKLNFSFERKGLMFVLSSPSGAGKSTIARHLLQEEPRLSLSVSVTTRKRRPNEIEGTDYLFKSKNEFDMVREGNGLLEWANVHGNFYGTPLEPVEQAMAEGRDMLFDIDWQGALKIFERAPADIVSVFILPPSIAELKNRLIFRAEDTKDVIDERLENARNEIGHWIDYDYIVINDDLDRAFSEVKSILQSERLRRDRQVGIGNFISDMLT
ncbi:guanylate kinase [Candidatus Endowatersipora endosymbiont of Watersipora subatra]|uniref:guanylate kinase n=1 Tax=Candidatus Endowatersipora endosymbiont of Watersipora subatra TaxID=3077946 RepID=UPI00312C946A